MGLWRGAAAISEEDVIPGRQRDTWMTKDSKSDVLHFESKILLAQEKTKQEEQEEGVESKEKLR